MLKLIIGYIVLFNLALALCIVSYISGYTIMAIGSGFVLGLTTGAFLCIRDEMRNNVKVWWAEKVYMDEPIGQEN